MKVWESIATEPGSSRAIWSKTFYKDGVTFNLATETDTLNRPSSFLSNFFNTFTPVDTLKGVNPFVKKSDIFFADFLSNDSVVHKRAVSSIQDIVLDATDLPNLKRAIAMINWSEKNYLNTKELVNKLGDMVSNESADYLKQLYFALDDTVSVQYAVLENLLQQKTAYAFSTFKDIISIEPPVKDDDNNYKTDYTYYGGYNNVFQNFATDNGDFMDELSDTLSLTKTILPDLLPLLNLNDYKNDMMTLLAKLIDSNLVKPADYEMYFSKFYLEAKQELKKQSIAETKKSIEKAEENKSGKNNSYDYMDQYNSDLGNENLSLYAKLLLPFEATKPVVQPLLQKMLKSDDKKVKYNTMMLFLKNKKNIPDTLYNYFASLDEYSYELYSDLKELKQLDKFPSKFNDKDALAKSKLLFYKSYGKPDTLVFLSKQLVTHKGKTGFIYFYKYKNKKVDLGWKLATSGMISTVASMLDVEPDDSNSSKRYETIGLKNVSMSSVATYDFTGFTETKLNDDEPESKQIDKMLRKLIFQK
jgi:hypothetical protein